MKVLAVIVLVIGAVLLYAASKGESVSSLLTAFKSKVGGQQSG